MAKLAHLQELKKSTPLDPKQERYDAVLQELEVLRMSNPSLDPDYQKKKEKLFLLSHEMGINERQRVKWPIS